MKKILLTLFVICLIFPTTISAESLYLYHNIPFALTSSSELEQILTKEFGETNKNEYGMYIINDFGYSFDMQVDYNHQSSGISRIVLHRTGNGYGESDSFHLLVQQDIEQFIDMEKLLTQNYGRPSFRFFYTYMGTDATLLTKYMFSDDDWNSKRLMEVYESNQYIVAYSVWNNVFLRVTSNGVDKRPRGYFTKLDLQFNCQSEWREIPIIIEYNPN